MHYLKGTIFSAKGFLTLVALSYSLIAYSQNKDLLWKVSGNGLTRPSYIYATLHTNDTKALELKEPVQHALDSSEVFITETFPDTAEAPVAVAQLTGDREYSLNAYLAKADYTDLQKILKEEYHLQLSNLMKVKPIFLYLVLLEEPESDIKPFMEEHLYKLAEKKGKKLVALENSKDLAAALDSINLGEQADLLKTAIKYHKKGLRDDKKLLQYYLACDMDKTLQFLQKYNYPENLFRILIRNNDVALTDHIDAIIKQQPAFVAIGIAHLAGEGNILQLLEKQGYKVARVK